MKNYGIDLEKEKQDTSEKDWVFGADSPVGLGDKIAGLVIALHAWSYPRNGIYPRIMETINHCVILFNEKLKKYFPIGEIQNGLEDFMDCVTRGHNNEIEKQTNYILDFKLFSNDLVAWLNEKGYLTSDEHGVLTGIEVADRFPAILSNTSRSGNSMIAPIQAIHDYGCIPKSMLPKRDNMTWSQYHNKNDITEEMMELGREWKKRILINYEKVYKSRFDKFIGDIKWYIFDNYIDKVDGDFVKRLAPDYNFMNYGYRIIINEIKQNIMDKTKAKIVKIANSKEVGIYVPAIGEKTFINIASNHGINVPIVNDEIDWENVNIMGEVELYEKGEKASELIKPNFWEFIKKLWS